MTAQNGESSLSDHHQAGSGKPASSTVAAGRGDQQLADHWHGGAVA